MKAYQKLVLAAYADAAAKRDAETKAEQERIRTRNELCRGLARQVTDRFAEIYPAFAEIAYLHEKDSAKAIEHNVDQVLTDGSDIWQIPLCLSLNAEYYLSVWYDTERDIFVENRYDAVPLTLTGLADYMMRCAKSWEVDLPHLWADEETNEIGAW